MPRAGGGIRRRALIPSGLRKYRPAGGPEGGGGRSGAAADGGSSSGPGEGGLAGVWGWADAARPAGRAARPAGAGAAANMTEPASIRSPAGWEGESGAGGSSAIEAAGSEGSSGSSAQGGLSGHGGKGAVHVVPGLEAAVGVGAGVDEVIRCFKGTGQGSQTSRRTGGRCSILPTVSLP